MASPFDDYPQPAWNAAPTVRQAIERLLAVQKGAHMEAYNNLLYAIGNNHAGTYFPVAVPVVRALARALAVAPLQTAEAILDCLIDLLSFEPEPGYENHDFGMGMESVKCVLHEAIVRHRALYRELSAEPGRPGKLAAELLWILE